MREPQVRTKMLADDPWEVYTWEGLRRLDYSNVYRFSMPYNYTPRRDESVMAMSEREGRSVQEIVYDLLLEDDGMGFLYMPLSNFVSGDLSVCEEMLANPNSIMGLGDGGAHLGFLLDSGFPTWLLNYWVKERERFSLAEGVRRLTSDTADAIGLTDRGRLAVGLRADINVIDMDELGFGPIYVNYDLPSGGKRLLQRGLGYDATVVDGTITYRHGDDTGARPGRLVRSSAGFGA
jgi:N-acyl-D-aspartate/D-glutamate deacylase